MLVAAIVPWGMDLEASFKSPDLFDPAIIPSNECQIYDIKITFNIWKKSGITCDRWKKYSHQYDERRRNVSRNIFIISIRMFIFTLFVFSKFVGGVAFPS